VKVRYTLPALADLNSILEYITAHSPRGAFRDESETSSMFSRLIRISVFARMIRLFAV